MFSEICAVMLSFKLLVFLSGDLNLVFPIIITIKNHFCFTIHSLPRLSRFQLGKSLYASLLPVFHCSFAAQDAFFEFLKGLRVWPNNFTVALTRIAGPFACFTHISSKGKEVFHLKVTLLGHHVELCPDNSSNTTPQIRTEHTYLASGGMLSVKTTHKTCSAGWHRAREAAFVKAVV